MGLINLRVFQTCLKWKEKWRGGKNKKNNIFNYLHCGCETTIFRSVWLLWTEASYMSSGWLCLHKDSAPSVCVCVPLFAPLLVRYFTQRPKVLLQAPWLSARQSKWSWNNTGGSDLASPLFNVQRVPLSPHPNTTPPSLQHSPYSPRSSELYHH